MYQLKNSWDKVLGNEFEKPYFLELCEFLKKEYAERTIYPPKQRVFSALKTTEFDDVKVVILGQDPYHGEGQAHGLAFSVQPGVQPPPSLVNMFKEINTEYGTKLGKNGCLLSWAKQGVLLLNTALTVRAGQANSHKGMGWETFTDAVIKALNQKQTPVVFMLWGANARSKKKLITNENHLVLETVHPSPLSAYNGFFGCNHFKKANDFLSKFTTPIDWASVESFE